MTMHESVTCVYFFLLFDGTIKTAKEISSWKVKMPLFRKNKSELQ